MKDQLENLIRYLTPKQRMQSIINIENTVELNSMLNSDKITVEFSGPTKNLYFAGLGEVKSYHSRVDLFYKINGRLIVKPKSIVEYLAQLNNTKSVQSSIGLDLSCQDIFRDWR
jgi:hypothetical protein